MWEIGTQGKLWHVIRNIYNVNQSCIYLNGINQNISVLLRALHRVVPISNIVPKFVDGISKGWRTFGDFHTLKVTGHQRKA